MPQNKTQSGNVLFLILIAVVLFAGLSYAVSQGTRGTAGGSDREASELGISSLLQYVTSIRTIAFRLIASGTANPQIHPPSIDICFENDDLCVFRQTTYHSQDDIRQIFKLESASHMDHHLVQLDDRLYGFMSIRNIGLDACEAINEFVEVSRPTIPDDQDLASLAPLMLDQALFCYENSGNGQYSLRINVYDEILV